eukprot:2432886-Prymnesium_polylepis.1
MAMERRCLELSVRIFLIHWPGETITCFCPGCPGVSARTIVGHARGIPLPVLEAAARGRGRCA